MSKKSKDKKKNKIKRLPQERLNFDATYIALRNVFDSMDSQATVGNDIDANELLLKLKDINQLSFLLIEEVQLRIKQFLTHD